MYAILKEQVASYALQDQVVKVVRVEDYSIPSGMLESVFTAAGQLLGSDGVSSPAVIAAPTVEGDILRARLGQTVKMQWETVDLAQLVQTAVKTGAYTAINNDHVLVNASGVSADFEIALPATPTAGNKVRVTMVAEHATYKVTIGRNGSLVNGGTSTTDLSLVKKGDSVYFEYTGATLGWGTLPKSVHTAINTATAKATPVDADRLGIWDSVSGLLNHVTWTNIKATLKTYFDTLYSTLASMSAENALDLTDGGATTLHSHAGGGDKYPMEARLTLETGVPISTTDQLAKTTLYLTKHKGDQVAVYDGSSAWSTIALTTDLSITLASLTADLPYDVFVYSNAGTLTLELTAWTNTTTRATALTTQNGIYVKTGATTRRYVGTICITATTGQCEVSTKFMGVWNYYNRVLNSLSCVDTTNTWTYATATWRASNGSTVLGVGRVACVVGVVEDIIKATAIDNVYTTGVSPAGGVGINSTSVNSAQMFGWDGVGGGRVQITAPFVGRLSAGYNYIQHIEIASAATATFYGDNGGSLMKNGMVAEVMA